MGHEVKSFQIPQQKPLSDEEKFTGTLRVYFGRRFKFKSTTEIQVCLKVGCMLDDVFCEDDNGELILDKEDNKMPRYAHVGTYSLTFTEKSKLPKLYAKLFPNETPLTLDKWNKDLQGGDLFIALVNNQKCSVYLTEPETKGDSVYQAVSKIKDFTPNPEPDVSKNPPEKGIDGKPIQAPQTGSQEVEDEDDVPF